MSIVRGQVETYRSTSDGFIGSEGLEAPNGGVSGVYGNATVYPSLTVINGSITAATTYPRAVGVSTTVGDATNYPVLTMVNGEVTAVTTQPRAVGSSGTYGDATNYPVVTLVNGEVTSVTTQPRAVGVSGTYGATFTHPVVTTVNGAVTVASSVRNSVSSVCWTSSDSSVPAGGVSPSYSTVAYDSFDIITETVAGSSGMKLTARGLYLLTFVGQAAAAQTIRLYANGVQVPGAFQVNPSSGMNLSIAYPFDAGTNVYFACSVAATYSAVFRAFTVMRLQ
jgi:hypothetical protein